MADRDVGLDARGTIAEHDDAIGEEQGFLAVMVTSSVVNPLRCHSAAISACILGVAAESRRDE